MTARQTLLYGGHILGGGGEWPLGWILIEGDQIAALGAGEAPIVDGAQRVDAGGCYAIPGFIDMHCHGALGCAVLDGNVEVLRTIAQHYARHGTTTFLPSLETASFEQAMQALDAIAQGMASSTRGAAILGAHLEGPYLNLAKCGAQDTRYIRKADRAEAEAFMDTGVIRMIALAPEIPENQWLIEEASARGIVVAAGHTEATPADISKAVALGLRQATHTFNAMTGLHHRHPGTVGAVMTQDAIYCELIADGHHVDPVAMDVLIRVKGLDKVIVITDAAPFAGSPPGEYTLHGVRHIVREDRIELEDGTLAGAAGMMDHNLRQVMAAGRLSLAEAWPLTSLNAATQLGISDRKGKLAVGYDADLVLLDASYQVRRTIVAGETAFSA